MNAFSLFFLPLFFLMNLFYTSFNLLLILIFLLNPSSHDYSYCKAFLQKYLVFLFEYML